MTGCPAPSSYRSRADIGAVHECGRPATRLDADGVYRCGLHCDAARARKVGAVAAGNTYAPARVRDFVFGRAAPDARVEARARRLASDDWHGGAQAIGRAPHGAGCPCEEGWRGYVSRACDDLNRADRRRGRR